MTIPKKKSRKITIQGDVYRYIVKGKMLSEDQIDDLSSKISKSSKVNFSLLKDYPIGWNSKDLSKNKEIFKGHIVVQKDIKQHGDILKMNIFICSGISSGIVGHMITCALSEGWKPDGKSSKLWETNANTYLWLWSLCKQEIKGK
jgi:hypothetical protein